MRWMGVGGKPARLGLVLVLVGLGGSAGRGQHTTPSQLPSGIPSASPGDAGGPDAALGESRRKQAELRNDERQKRLVSDTDKLLQLATSLHEDVAKTNKNVLSVDVIRRADEIERLAREVKERMRN